MSKLKSETSFEHKYGKLNKKTRVVITFGFFERFSILFGAKLIVRETLVLKCGEGTKIEKIEKQEIKRTLI